jgi:hypothetical protein
MTRQFRTILLSLTLVLILSNCSNPKTSDKTNSVDTTIKFQQTDPFGKSITESQYFELNSKTDNVIEGKNGTIIVCPKGCFMDSKNEIVEGNIKIELTEALSLEEMILSNLTTTSNGKLLETDGMIYFNATSNGEKLTINKENPIHIEIPTKNKKNGMSAYEGIRDSLGNMNWVDPKPLENYLIPIDINLLDFLPENFQAEVEKGMPYKKYTTATKDLVDSLYYILSVTNGSELIKGFVNTDINEPYYNKKKQVVNGKYTNQSYQRNSNSDTTILQNDSSTIPKTCGIDPAIIKVIKSKKYQNTLISTKEFEERLKIIFKTCNSYVLEIYIKNLDKNLYTLDSLAEIEVRETQYSHNFHDFYLQKKTNVKNANKYSKLLQDYYEKQLTKIKVNLENAKLKVVNQLNKKNKEAENIVNDYRELLWGREKYRMETYGFNWTETGWINIDTGTIPKNWGPQRLEITIQNSNQFDRIYSYVVYTTIKSIYRLNTDNNELFYVGNSAEKEMLMPKRSVAFAIVVAYKDENSFLTIKQFETGTNKTLSLLPTLSTQKEIKATLKEYNRGYEKENKISEDLLFMDKFFIEQKRQKSLIKESEFIKRLWYIAYPCCQEPNTVDLIMEK